MLRIAGCAFLAYQLVACGAPAEQSSALKTARPYPLAPHEHVTPGETCQDADYYRYPEHIAYCSRDVSSGTKKAIIRDYDDRFGYSIGSMERSDFKIDHYIPLCMGGSNNTANLWPQHKSVYEHTDPIEQRLCEMMAQGRLLQADAIAKIKDVKNDLAQAEPLLDELRDQLGH